MIKAVLFDCDGLMFNTERESQKMWKEEADKFGVTIPSSFFVIYTGARKDVDVSWYYENVPHFKEIQDNMAKRRFDLNHWKTFYPDKLNKKGLVQLENYLHEHHILHAVCSSSSHEYVECLLNTVSAPMHFDAIVGGNEVKHGKPAPDIFLKGAEIFHVKPEECLVLEDSKNGILAAHAAGMHSCFIEDTVKKDSEMMSVLEYEKKDLSQVIDLLEEINHE